MKELLYRKISNSIRSKIEDNEYPEGFRLPGVRELSEEWNTSSNTILKALDELEAGCFIKKVRGSGIFVQNSSEWKAKVLRLPEIDFFLYDLDVPFNRSLVSSVEKAAGDFGYNLRIKTFDDISTLSLSDSLPAIVVPREVNDSCYKLHKDRNIPLIFTGEFSPPPNLNEDYAVANVYEGFYSAVEYLIKSGRQNIAFIASDDDYQNDAAWNAYFDIVSGVRLCSCRDYSVSAGGWNPEQGKKAMETLFLGGEFPDAVVCRNDALAAGAMKAAKNAGHRIPDDICFIGSGSQDIASLLEPSLSSIKMPADIIGLSVVSYIDNILHGRVLPGMKFNTKFSPRLILRESTSSGESSVDDELYWV
ncbi:MAG: GntR family transcriptional regulator [Spirochaetales bacterium]|nr:GntR family transcriptional regulator [Spirochaetales bacterium]